jgi:hypothetical protein
MESEHMSENLPIPSKHVAALLDKGQAPHRGRLIFIVDATGSRKESWDLASKLQAEMFQEAARFGALDVQLVNFRGNADFGGECKVSRWTNNAHELPRLMARITCETGETQFRRAFEHVRKEHRHQPINACVCIGDAFEEEEELPALYKVISGIGAPVFIFQEGEDRVAAVVFREIARLTRGAYHSFHPGAADQLRELLGAVAAFATGGLKALENRHTGSARKLLEQIKRTTR